MDSEDTKKLLKKPVKVKKEIKCLNCEQSVDFETNRFFCSTHFDQHKNDEFCNAVKTNKEKCHYNSKLHGFCGQHISIPKEEDFIKIEPNTSRKILLNPTEKQRTILKQWFGVSRKTYNQAVSSLNKKRLNFSNVRDTITKNLDKIEYCKQVPLKIKQESVCDAIKAVKNAILKYNKIKKFQKIRFKSRLAPSHSIYINKDAMKKLDDHNINIYPRILGKITSKEKIPDILTHCRISVKYNRYFYLCIPQELEIKNAKPVFENEVVALDPGIRSFQSFYSNKMAGNIGINTRQRFDKIYKDYDRLISKTKKIKNKLKGKRGKERRKYNNKIKHLRKKYLTLISKPTRLVKELHYKTSLFLCKNFDTIIIPAYSSKQLTENLCPLINRSNQALSHYSFRERLYHTAKRFKRKVHTVTEEYTSMTCTNCGNVNPKNKNEILTCKNCNITMNRDLRGARNIWLKNIIEIQNLI
jgi:putative transposase